MAERPEFPQAQHGTRARYVTGCRCEECRGANRVAYHAHQARARAAAGELGPRTESHCVGVAGAPCPARRKLYKRSTGNVCAECRARLVWNGLVPAARARAHLRRLSRRGIGLKAVSAATDLARSVLQKIYSGTRAQIRAQNERLILAVDAGAISDGALVPAGPVWAKVERLVRDHGFTLAEISRRIGQDGRRLQLGRHLMTARSAHRVGRLLADAEGDFLE